MDDDTSSVDSFEEVPSPPAEELRPGEEKNIELLRDLVLKQTTYGGDGDAKKELEDEEAPDVCYVLQYRGMGGKLVDGKLESPPILQLIRGDGD